jgi:hypothetical protein
MWNESFAEWRGGNIMLQMWQGYVLNHTVCEIKHILAGNKA